MVKFQILTRCVILDTPLAGQRVLGGVEHLMKPRKLRARFQQILILSLSAAIASASSYASLHSSHKKKSYPATEEAPSEEVISSAPGYRGQTTAPASETASAPTPVVTIEPLSQPAPQRGTPPTQVTQTPLAATASGQVSEVSFDAVPASQVEPLARRLQLVQTLLTKYDRAYDYRTMTVPQLEAALAKLDAQATAAAELRNRTESRVELKKEVREEENATTAVSAEPEPPAPSYEDSIGSAAPDAPIPPPPPPAQ